MNPAPRKSAISTIRAIVKAGDPGMWSQGDGLYLVIGRSGNAHWAYRYSFAGKRRTMTVATYTDPNAASFKALELAVAHLNKQVHAGVDPLAERDGVEEAAKPKANMKGDCFEEAGRAYIAENEPGWKNEKHRYQWKATLDSYVYPMIGKKLPWEITTGDVVSVLRQPYKNTTLWDGARETAMRVRMRIEAILGRAFALGKDDPRFAAQWATFRNPAIWKGHLDRILKDNRQAKAHYKAMDWMDVPAFFAELQAKSDYSAEALKLTILCATRSLETLNATWAEIDLANATWHIPAERMKAGKPHSIPLSTVAIDLLKTVPRIEGNPHVFPGAVEGMPLSNMAMIMMLRKMRLSENLTVHGFRSAFRDWVSETTYHPDAIAEAALAHTVKNKTEAAYRRGTAFERRRQIMQQWCDYLTMKPEEYQKKWQLLVAVEMKVAA